MADSNPSMLPDTLPTDIVALSTSAPAPIVGRDVQVSEELAGTSAFNTTTNAADAVATYRITISCVVVRLSESQTPELYKRLNKRRNLRALVIFADVVEISSPLKIPECTVEIHARQLKITRDGLIDTSGPDFDDVADAAVGRTGAPAGAVVLDERSTRRRGRIRRSARKAARASRRERASGARMACQCRSGTA